MLVKKRYITDTEAEGLLGNIIRHTQKDNRKPVAVIGIVRGGLTPAVMLSHYFDVPLYILDYSLRDRNDAQEFTDHDKKVVAKAFANVSDDKHQHILVIDDINDSGDTLQAIRDFIYDETHGWAGVLYATLLEKCTSRFDCDYYGELLMDERCDDWIVFPWEEWWQNKG